MINSSDSKNYKKISSSLKHRGELTFIYSLIPQNENLRWIQLFFSLIYSSLITEETEEERKGHKQANCR